MYDAIRKADEFGPPPEYVHDSQQDVDEGAEDQVPADRAAALQEAQMEAAEPYTRKPMTSVEERRHARFKAKQSQQQAAKCVNGCRVVGWGGGCRHRRTDGPAGCVKQTTGPAPLRC